MTMIRRMLNLSLGLTLLAGCGPGRQPDPGAGADGVAGAGGVVSAGARETRFRQRGPGLGAGAEERKIPYSEILQYPPDWPDIVETRGR